MSTSTTDTHQTLKAAYAARLAARREKQVRDARDVRIDATLRRKAAARRHKSIAGLAQRRLTTTTAVCRRVASPAGRGSAPARTTTKVSAEEVARRKREKKEREVRRRERENERVMEMEMEAARASGGAEDPFAEFWA